MGERLAVAVVVRRADGRYLLVRRAPGRPAAGYWTPVTGRPKAGESLEEAARREVLEEVGLEITVGAELMRSPTVGASYTLVWFAAAPWPEEGLDDLRLQEDEVDGARWLTAADAANLEPMFEPTRRFYRERGHSAAS